MTAARVWEVILVARRIADPRDALGREARARLLTTSGLSAEGVELALTEYLETSPTREEIFALVARATPAPRCHVVLSANVCTAPMRAIACAVACAPRVLVKPSRRDPVMAELLAGELAHLGVALCAELEVAAGDALHVYGSDETIAAIVPTLGPGVMVKAHGSGIGVAVVNDAAAAAEVATDLVVFDGQGCLSPRFVLVEGAAGEFADALHAALSGSAVPRGPLTPEENAALARARRTWQAIGGWLEGPHHALAIDPAPEALTLLPACRAALVAPAVPKDLLEPWRNYITVVGGSGPLADRVAALCPRARRSELGRMQKPPFDGPVDLRAG